MKLNPVVSHVEPSYPDRTLRPRRWTCWLRRAIAAAGVSAAVWLAAGCDGPGIGPRLAGDMPPPGNHYACGAEPPAATPSVNVPGNYSTSLCDSGQAAWGTFELQLNTPLVFFFETGGEAVIAQIQDAEGLVVDELRPDEDEIELVLAPGQYFLAFRPVLEDDPYYYFSFDIDYAL